MATSSNGTKDKDADKKSESVDEEADEKDERDEDEGDEGEGDEGEGEGEKDDAEASGDKGDAEESPPAKAKAPSGGAVKAKAAGRDVPEKKGADVAPAPPPTAGLGKSVMLFVAVVGGLSLLMVVLGNSGSQGGAPAPPPKWNDGQVVDIDITLVSTDKQDLACASGTEVGGLHCGFESPQKRWTKSDPTDDKKTLRPYSSASMPQNNFNFLAAGVWSEPALAPDKLPNARFTIKCKFTVAGKMPRADVRWHENEAFNNVTDWYAGAVSNCTMGTIQN